jgi:hypothetical protein
VEIGKYKEDDASFAVVIGVSTPVDKPLPKRRNTEGEIIGR